MRVPLNGYVVADDDAWIYEWFGYSVISPAGVRRAIQENPAGEDLVFEINSGGGSVFAGFEIYSVLRSAQGVRTVAEIQSLAASAASTLMLGCDEVLISPVAQVMIHNPSTYTSGNQAAHRDSIHVLDSITESILNGYEAKSGGKRTRDQLRRMMANSTWLTAQEALDAGLVDGLLYQEEPTSASIVNSVGSGMRALMGSAGLPDPEKLRAEYRAMQQGNPAEGGQKPAGNPPADDQSWRDRALLDLEKIRFI